MKKISKGIIIINTFLFIIIFNSISYCKYIIEGNLIVAQLSIDRTLPTGIVEYSTENDMQEIKATISLSEPINDVEGWELSENRLTLTKIYGENSSEAVKITDMSGNENIVEVSIEIN